MRTSSILLAIFALLGSVAQSAPRLELLTRATPPITHSGGDALSGAPEISRDGSNILFLSLAQNLTPQRPSQSLNLYLFNQTSNALTLISASTNGERANLDVENYYASANLRRIVFESRASNLVANDTNDAVDVFLRDLDSNQTILVSAETNGASGGGFDASLSADGTRVAFVSASKKMAPNSDSVTWNVFVRYISEARTELISGRGAFSYRPTAAISENGQRVMFTFDGTLASNINSSKQIFVRDLVTKALTQVSDPNDMQSSFDPVFSGNGQAVAYSGLQEGNWFVKLFDLPSAARKTLRYGGASGPLQALALSPNGETGVYRTSAPTLPIAFWHNGLSNSVFGSPVFFSESLLDLSADGRFVAYMASTNAPAGAAAIRTRLFDIQETNFTDISISGDGAPTGNSPSDSSMNGDGSAVAFVGNDPLLDDDEPQNNIYLWNKSTGRGELISKGLPSVPQISQSRASSHSQYGSVSDDGQRLVYQSLEPIDAVAKTNPVWNIFLLDRATGQKQLISRRPAAGPGGGNKSSYGAIISGNGRSVAYLTRATNLFANASPLNLVVKDLVTDSVLIANRPVAEDYKSTRVGDLGLSRDGRYLTFTSDRLDSFTPARNIYLFDAFENRRVLITARPDGTPLFDQFPGPFNAAISRDGQQIAFQSYSGTEFGYGGTGLKTLLRARTGGAFKLISTDPADLTLNPGNLRTGVHFNFDSSAVIFGGRLANLVEYFNLQNQTTNTAATGALEAVISNDLQWSALVRVVSDRKHIYLRNLATGAETWVTTNANHHSYNPQLTTDGRHVIFESRASNLATNDNNNDLDLFLYDRVENRLELLTRNDAGASANRASQRPVLCPDGLTLIFKSFASDLVPGDTNDDPDLFALTLPILKITGLQVVGSKLRITWNSQPGLTYRLQSRPFVNGGLWTTEAINSGDIDLPATSARFYRVITDP